MAVPARLTFHDCGYALDGGTYHLHATDERGTEHYFTLVQHAFVGPGSDLRRIPGRLYFDGELVAIRSELESKLLLLFKAAAVRVAPSAMESSGSSGFAAHAVIGDDIKRFLSRTPEEQVRGALDDLVSFIESERYVSFAEVVDRQRGSV